MIVDDDGILRDNIAEILSETEYEIHQATTGEEAVNLIALESFELIRKLLKGDNATRVLAITGHSGDVDHL